MGTLITFVLRWLILAAAVWLAAWLVPGIHLGGWESTLGVALFLGILNVLLKPVLVFFSLPLLLVTLGLFLIVINTVLLLLAEWTVGTFTDLRFEIDGFWPAVLGSIIISISTFIITRFIRPERIGRSVAGGRGL